MNPGRLNLSCGARNGIPVRGFTLLELLIVIGIIGILTSIGLPALKGFGRSNLTAAANRQLLDDLAMARLRAINGRTTVYMAFVPPTLSQRFAEIQAAGINGPAELRQLTNLISGQFSGYALISKRTLGDQPGRDSARYLTEWKTLPDGMLFAPYKFNSQFSNHPDEYLRTLPVAPLPFPNLRSGTFPLPYIAFNAQGQLVSMRDELIPLAKGSIFFQRNADGSYARAPVNPSDIVLRPPAQGTNNLQYVRVNWLTGRAKAELPALP
jgi:prepilin-type N-terminal cleavage/methylation domain-containing protein